MALLTKRWRGLKERLQALKNQKGEKENEI